MHDRYTLGFEIGKTINNSSTPSEDIQYLITLLLQHWKMYIKEKTGLYNKIEEIIKQCYL